MNTFHVVDLHRYLKENNLAKVEHYFQNTDRWEGVFGGLLSGEEFIDEHAKIIRFCVRTKSPAFDLVLKHTPPVDLSAAMHVACDVGHADLLHALVTHPTQKHLNSTKWEWCAWQAARKGHVDCLQVMIDAGCCVEQLGLEWAKQAVRCIQPRVLTYLIDQPEMSKHRTTLLKFFVQETVDGDRRVPLLIDNDTIAQCLYDLADMNHIYESLPSADQEMLDNPLHSSPTMLRWRADRQAQVLQQEIVPKGLPTASKRM